MFCMLRKPAPFASAPSALRSTDCTTTTSAFPGTAHSSAGGSFSFRGISSSFNLGLARLELSEVAHLAAVSDPHSRVRRAALYRIPCFTILMTVEHCAGASVAATPSFVLADVTGTEQSSRYCIAASLLAV